MSITEDSSVILDARFLSINNADPLSGFPLDPSGGSVTIPPYTFERNTGTGVSLVSDLLTFGVNGVTTSVVGMDGNVSIGPSPSDYGVTTPGEGVLFINNVTTAPTSGTPGGLLYVSGSSLSFKDLNGSTIVISSKSGDVIGGSPTTLNSVASFDGATGKLIQDTFLLATASTLLAPDGTSANSTYAFTADGNTGLNLEGGFSMNTGNGDRLHLMTDSVEIQTTPLNIWAPDGTPGTPAYSFNPTTGVFLDGTDVGVSVGGVTGIVVANAGAAANVSLAGSAPSDYGAGTSGVGVVFLPEASVVPSGVPNMGAGAILYVSSDKLYILRPDGNSRDLTLCVAEPSGTTTLNGVVRFSGTTGKAVQDTTALTVNSAGQWAGPDGDLTAVTYGFTGDPNTGLYSEGAGITNLVAGGVSQMRVSATNITFPGDLLFPDGSETAPAYSFTAAPTSGVYRASGAVCVSAGECAISAFDTANCSLCGPPADDFGGGDKTLLLHQVTTAPSTNPSNGVLMYVDADELFVRTPSGTVFNLTDTVTGPGSATDEALVLFSGTTGKIVQNSLVTESAGKLSSGDGLVSAPAYSFTNSPDTGMYIAGTDVYLTAGGGVGGIGQLAVGTAVSAATQFRLTQGTAALPSLTFTGDLDTGMYSTLGNLVVSAGGKVGLTLGLGNVSLTGTPSFGGGENVVYMEEFGVAPVGTLASGGILYVSGTDLILHDDAGATTILNNSHMSGPASSVVDAVAFWDNTSGTSFTSSAVLASSTQMTAARFERSDSVGIFEDASRLSLTTTTGSLLIGSGGVEVGMPLHADTSLRIGGAGGVSEVLSGSVMTSNHLAAGTFEWRRDGATIFSTTTPGLDLTTPNAYVFPATTENLSIGNTSGTKYTISSTSSGTADTIALAVNSVTRITFTESDPSVGDAMSSTGGRFGDSGGTILAADGSVSAPAYTSTRSLTSGMYYDAASTSLCFASGGKLSASLVEANMAVCVSSPPSTYNGGDGVIYFGDVISVPTTIGTPVLLVSDGDLRVFASSNEDRNCSTNALARRALVSISGYTVSDATSDDLDGETWTDVDSAGVSGTTSGALNIPTSDTTVMVIAQATWVSNSTGYRRVSITTGAGHTVEATATSGAVNGDVTSQTVTLVRRVDAANLQFSVQVYQNSGGNLDVDVTMSMVRLN